VPAFDHRDALQLGEIVIRILSQRQVKEPVLNSPQHIARPLGSANAVPARPCPLPSLALGRKPEPQNVARRDLLDFMYLLSQQRPGFH